MPAQDLKAKAISGIKWSVVAQAARQVLQLGTSVALARLLSPHDFGVVGMAMIPIGLAMVFKDLGMTSAVIQKQAFSAKFLSTVFWVNCAFGLLVTAGMFSTASLTATFFGEPEVGPIFRALSFTFLIASLGGVHQAILEKEIAFERVARIDVLSAAAGAVAGVGMALAGAGLWSLVSQTVVTAVAGSAMFWISSRWRPRFEFSGADIREISGFSLNLVAFNAFNYFARNTDYLLIGKFLGARELGLYTLAYKVMLIMRNVASLMGKVMVPLYSKLQNDDGRIRGIYMQLIKALSLVSFPALLSLVAIGGPLVRSVFGDEWSASARLLMILAPVGLIQSIQTTVGTIYVAKGRTDLMSRWGLLTSTLTVWAFLVGIRWGAVGVAVSYLVVCMLLAAPNFRVPLRLIGLGMPEFLGALTKPLFCGVAMMAALFAIVRALPADAGDARILLVALPSAIAFYALLAWLTSRDDLIRIAGALRPGAARAGAEP